MKMSYVASSLRLALCAAAFLFVSPSADAQCPVGPDKLDAGPCCTTVTPNLPLFPPAGLPARGVCWNNCGVAGTENLRVEWTPPSQIQCAQYITQLTVSTPAGVPVLSGSLILDYTRTWDEIEPTGAATQVWRFAAKAELSAVAGTAASTCVVPSCVAPVGPYATAFYYGYVDYENCDPTTPWEEALVLYHACDNFIHRPGLSDKPGTFHPGRSYAIIAPHSTVQPFVPTASIAPGGPLVGEATRNVTSGCTVEDAVASGSMTPLGAGCVCTLSSFPNQQTVRELKGTTSCVNTAGVPGNFTTVDLFPPLPWLHLVSTSLGRWTSPLVYPGIEETWADEGVFVLQDACSGDFAEFKYGGSTRGGWPATLATGVSTNNFTDLASNYTAPLFGPYPGPFVGSLRPTRHLLYVNVP